jgi:hypothetical protein
LQFGLLLFFSKLKCFFPYLDELGDRVVLGH